MSDGVNMKASTSSNVPNTLRINPKKVLELKTAADCQIFNDDVQILHLDCKILENVREILNNFEVIKFPNAFAMTANLNFEPEQEFLSLLNSKIGSNCDFFLHTKFHKNMKAFYKPTGSENFALIIKSTEINVITSKLKVLSLKKSRKLETIENFFLLLNLQNQLLNEADFNYILNIFELNNREDKYLHLKGAIEAKNKSLVMLLSLFVQTFDEELLRLAFQSENEDIIKAIWINFKEFRGNFKDFSKMREIVVEANFQNFETELQAFEINFYESDEPSYKKQKLDDLDFEKLHANINSGHLRNVKKFVKEFPQQKLCFYNQKTALEKAFECKKFEIYCFLISQGFHPNDQATLNDKIKILFDEDKKQIDEFTRKYLKKSPDYHLDILSSKKRFFVKPDILSKDDFRKLLENVRKIEGGDEIMKILSQSDLTFAVDPEKSNICSIKASSMKVGKKGVETGVADPEQQIIYIALRIEPVKLVATLIHEMTHYVLHMIYENNCLPYCKHDVEREKEFDEIFKGIKKSEELDKIFIDIFKHYSEEKQKSELIARVPDFFACYNDVSNSIYQPLFTFYREKVLFDLNQPNVFQTIKLNNKFGLLGSIEGSNIEVATKEDEKLLNFSPKILVTQTPKLAISRIISELKEKKKHFKSKMLFVDVKKLKGFDEELEGLIESSSLERVVVEVTEKMTEESLESLSKLNDEIQFIFIGTKDNFEVTAKKQEVIIVEWKDLTEKSRQWLLGNKHVLFQDVEMTVGELFTNPSVSISADVLAFLCNNEDIRINCAANEEEVVNFIERKIISKKSAESLTLAEFIEKLRDYDNPVNKIIVSDSAGSGKTAFFKKLFNDLKNETNQLEKPKNFTIFVELRRYQKELKEYAGESFVDFMTKIKKFDVLTKALFEEKYKKGESVIFFDGFDEISSNYSENTNKLFNNFEEHESDLEALLKVYSNKLQILSQNEQIEYLAKVWKNPDLNQEFVGKCAQELVEKISEILQLPRVNSIGVPIILVTLAETYKDEINDDFERKIQKLNISEVYKKNVIEKLMEYSHVKNDKNLFQFWSMPQHPLQVHQYLSISFLLSEELAIYLGLNYDKNYWTFERIERYSIATFENEQIVFHHVTHAEYLVAYYLFEKLKNTPSFTDYEIEFMKICLVWFKSKLPQLFLNTMLENEENFDEFKFSNTSNANQICDILAKNKYILNYSCMDHFFSTVEFFTNLIYKMDKNIFRDFIEEDYRRAESIAQAKDVASIERFLEKMFVSGIDFEKMLTKSRPNTNFNLHQFALHAKSYTYFEAFWTKCGSLIKDDRKMKEIFIQIEGGNNLLLSTIEGETQTFKFIFNFARTQIFTDNQQDFEAFVFASNEVLPYNRESLITMAATVAKADTIRFLFQQIEVIFGKDKLKEILRSDYFGQNLLTWATKNQKKNSNAALCEIIENNLESNEVVEMIENRNEIFHGYNFLHWIASNVYKIENIKFWLQKIKFHLNNERFQKLLLGKDKIGRNALVFAATEFRNNKELFLFIFERFYCDHLKLEEFVREANDEGQNFFHVLAQESSNCSCLKTMIEILKAKLSDFEAFLNIKTQTGGIFHQIAENCEDSLIKFKFFANFIQREFGNEKLQKMLKATHDDLIPIHSVLTEFWIELFTILVSIYEQYFDENEMKILLNLKEKDFYEGVLNQFTCIEKNILANYTNILAKYDIEIVYT